MIHVWSSQKPKTAIQQEWRRFQENKSRVKELQGESR